MDCWNFYPGYVVFKDFWFKKSKTQFFRKRELNNRLLELSLQDIENPPMNFVIPERTDENEDPCLFYSKVAACRFYDRCRK